MIGALERLAAGASGDLGVIGVGTAEFGPTMVCLPLVVLFAATEGVIGGIFDF